MKIRLLDFISIDTKEEFHKYVKKEMEFPEYYGENLDALYDILTDSSSTILYLKNQDNLIEKLGDYGQSIIETFKDASKNCKNLFILSK